MSHKGPSYMSHGCRQAKAQTRSEKGWQTIGNSWDFNGGPVAKIPHSQCRELQGAIPGWGTRSYMSQLRVHMLQLKILHAITKTQRYQINKYFLKTGLALASEEQ